MARKYGGPLSERRKARMRAVVERRQFDLTVVLEDLADPHNAAAVYRSSEAFGLAELHIVAERAIWPGMHPAVTASAHRWVETRRWYDPELCCKGLQDRGFTVLCAALDDDARDYRDVDWTLPTALVLGQEKQGVSPDMLKRADGCVIVPMVGFAQSLNVSVCGGIVLSEALRQRREAGMCEPTWDDQREALFQRWVSREEGLPQSE
ncbi:MAG: RNA methyltransferase [Deltaproteobacteria bacterium]|nr:RNA methyltransferase [Deltaproteobacteria bacterium]